MANKNVCRLCLSEKELVPVFENSVVRPYNLKEVILVTTGVEILEGDVVSRSICTNCSRVVVKMFEFRDRSMKTDKYLKEQWSLNLKNNPHGDVQLKTEKIVPKKVIISSANLKLDLPKKKRIVHPSVSAVFSIDRNMKLPTDILAYDISPSVCMELDAVENYFAANNLDMNEAVQRAFRSSRASKSTSAVNKKPEQSKVDQKVSPISIKLHDDRHLIQVISKDVKRKLDDSDAEEEFKVNQKSCNFKRKRLSSDSDTNHPTLMETLQLKPKENIQYLCRICNSPQKTTLLLKKHLREHFRCNFCKSSFKLTQKKDYHEKKCPAKHALTCEAYVPLSRLDLSLLHKKKDSNGCNNAVNGNFEQQESSNDNLETNITNKTAVENTDIVIIDSDDESDVEPAMTPGHAPKVYLLQKPTSDTIQRLSKESRISSATNRVLASTTSQPSSSGNSRSDIPKYTSASILRPDIKIKDDHVLNEIDTADIDLKVLKTLLTRNAVVDFKLSVDGEVQTQLPSTDTIANKDTSSPVFTGLLSQLFAYKVPVNIRNGDFDATYSKRIEQKYKNDIWGECSQPVDIKFANGNVNSHNTFQSIALVRPKPKTISTLVHHTDSNASLLNGQKRYTVMQSQPAQPHVENRIPPSVSENVASNQRVDLQFPVSLTTANTNQNVNNTVLNSYFLKPATPKTHLTVQGTNTSFFNHNNQILTYLPQDNIPNNNTANIPPNIVISRENADSVSNDYSVVNTLVLPSCSTLSGTIPPPNINPFSTGGIFGDNITQNSYSATVVASVSNHLTNSVNSSLGQSTQPSTSNIANTTNTLTRPLIRVRNLNDLR